MSGLGMIWAQDVTGVLGAGGGMLWRVPADFAHFKATTMGCGLVMGRTTWESLADGLPDVLVVSVLDLDATQRARERGLPDSALVRAPGISTQEWAIDPALSDPRGQWRPTSGDARWRVETWRHL